MSFNVQATADCDLKGLTTHIRALFVPPFVFIAPVLAFSPSTRGWESKKKARLFGVYRIKDEVNIISITFEPVNQQHNAEKHNCKRLTMPMSQELCDLPLSQRGGKRARTWRR